MDRHFSKISTNIGEIRRWCHSRISGKLLYLSADIRNARFKLAPVDVNIFPAGFHLLNKENQTLATRLISERYTGKTILLIIETHTRNTHYLSNVHTLKKLFEDAKNTVILGNPSDQKIENINTETFHIKDKRIITESGTTPDLIVLNNDMISLDPSVLLEVTQPCLPSPLLGWWKRTKTQYFPYYEKTVEEFSNTFELDPWLFYAYSEACDNINFDTQESLARLADVVDGIIQKIQKNYKQYGISSKPFVFIKANSGSYGMGILTASSGKEILSMNRKERKKLGTTKGNTAITSVIVQEGIETEEYYLNYPAETLMYSVLGKKIAFATRYNTKHDARQNLNSSGMHFSGHTPMKASQVQLEIVSDLIIIAAEKEAQSIDDKNVAALPHQAG
ncbi:glutamate--cysteine ligase [Neorickettsia sennetsu]|uniref:Glutamate--cysteine ligase n=1 Tax=Ehrlichia sennetsu (strain ATCC VR-367 / Miyayama) TaxID=222891 RepID=Q2GE98_EHRS3|nr:glutamate--cysteine ligase [Neorickettsia sennetsu]ABD46155.1 glutamate--cysteine ligase [Neorickettsia sennetsu str. Miyayama]